MKLSNKIFLFLMIGLSLEVSPLLAQSPLEVARTVADKVIRESSFEFELVPKATMPGIQVVVFRHNFGEHAMGISYALSFFAVKKIPQHCLTSVLLIELTFIKILSFSKKWI